MPNLNGRLKAAFGKILCVGIISLSTPASASIVHPGCDKYGPVPLNGYCWWYSEHIPYPSNMVEKPDVDMCCSEACPAGWCSDRQQCAETSTERSEYMPSSTVAGGYCLRYQTCLNCDNSCSWNITYCGNPSHCGAGYYKNGSTCTECPNKSSGATSPNYNTSGINGCYFPANINTQNASGTYHFTSNCSYTS